MDVESKPSNKTIHIKNAFTVSHFILTGLITIPLAMWFAAGTIGESETEFPAPGFFSLIAIWLFGLAIHYFSKLKWLGIIISILPVAYFIYRFVAPIFMYN